MAALRLELQGKDREVQELAGTVRMLQEQLEQVRSYMPDTAGGRLTYRVCSGTSSPRGAATIRRRTV